LTWTIPFQPLRQEIFLDNQALPAIQLFITDLVDTFYPETGEALVSILRRPGQPLVASLAPPLFVPNLQTALKRPEMAIPPAKYRFKSKSLAFLI
jgi:hypothetical protein